MNKYLRFIILATACAIIVWSCEPDIPTLAPENEKPIFLDQSDMEGMTQLGKKLENPYTVANMQSAWDNLQNADPGGRSAGLYDMAVATTHLYIRFKPENEDELTILKRDSALILYEYPLDYEIEEPGYFYHDPEVPIDQPTYQYCAVAVDKVLPEGVEYEVLDELFMPEEADEVQNAAGRTVSMDPDLSAVLVYEALRITHNLSPEDSISDLEEEGAPNGRAAFFRRILRRIIPPKWRPAGTIRLWDGSRYVGLEGAEVRARSFFVTRRGTANEYGWYSCDGRFRYKANYCIIWERYHFVVREGWLNRAEYNGPEKKGNWDLNIRYGEQEYFATIFRAARHYYYRDIQGLRRPPQNGTWKTQMKITAT